jgi:hypothetical protein
MNFKIKQRMILYYNAKVESTLRLCDRRSQLQRTKIRTKTDCPGWKGAKNVHRKESAGAGVGSNGDDRNGQWSPRMREENKTNESDQGQDIKGWVEVRVKFVYDARREETGDRQVKA